MADDADDYYGLLGVPKNASTNEIRQAFRRRALEQHPDRGGDPELFQSINKAYDVLSDPERRKYYDRTGRLERTVEEDFLDGFGRQAEATRRPAPNIKATRAFLTASCFVL